MFEFDAEKHEYRIDGATVLSVTQIVRGVIPSRDVGGWYLRRGSAIHRGVQLALAGTLDWGSVDSEIEPRIRAAEQFMRDYPADVVASEMPLYDPILRYAGTPDLILRRGRELIIADWKSSLSCHVCWQLAAYSLLWTRANPKQQISRAVAVELRDNGTYSCRWFESRELRLAEREFLAILTTWKILERERLLPPKETI